MTRIRIALEWFINPRHLPLLAVSERWQDDGLDSPGGDVVDEATFEAMFV